MPPKSQPARNARAQRLATARNAVGLSVQQAATKAGVSVGELTRIEIRATARQTSTATDFDLTIRLEVDVDGTRFFDRDWSERNWLDESMLRRTGDGEHRVEFARAETVFDL